MFKTPYSINIIILSSNVKRGRSFFLTFLSFKNNGLAKKLVNMLTKKPFNINDLAARGPRWPCGRGQLAPTCEPFSA